MKFLPALSVLAVLIAMALPAVAEDQTAPPAPAASAIDVTQLFATTCGWCHANAGRTAGRGPQLMDSPRSDDYIRTRIKLGKQGSMPAFGNSFSDADIDRIIVYIRTLKPE